MAPVECEASVSVAIQDSVGDPIVVEAEASVNVQVMDEVAEFAIYDIEG